MCAVSLCGARETALPRELRLRPTWRRRSAGTALRTSPLRTSSIRRSARARRSRSSTPTTTPRPSPTSPSTARSTACRPAPPRTAASARSTRTAAPPARGEPRLGRGDRTRPPWSRQPARTATSCSSRLGPLRSMTSVWPSTPRRGSVPTWFELLRRRRIPGTLALERKYYTHPGIAQVASSGDFGFGPAQFPASGSTTIGVGGTSLSRKDGVWKERAGGAPGAAAPPGSTNRLGNTTGIARRGWSRTSRRWPTPAPGSRSTTRSGWEGQRLDRCRGHEPFLTVDRRHDRPGRQRSCARLVPYIYRHRDGLADVVGGSNGFCGHDYLCTGKVGYDGPTGLGSPRGTSAL